MKSLCTRVTVLIRFETIIIITWTTETEFNVKHYRAYAYVYTNVYYNIWFYCPQCARASSRDSSHSCQRPTLFSLFFPFCFVPNFKGKTHVKRTCVYRTQKKNVVQKPLCSSQLQCVYARTMWTVSDEDCNSYILYSICSCYNIYRVYETTVIHTVLVLWYQTKIIVEM